MTRSRILVVDDEGIVAKDLQDRLRSLGWEVPDVAATGKEALEKARALTPDLVLMDIRLQGEIDGIAAAQRLRDELEIPVVYLTAYGDAATLARAKLTEPGGYLLKPFKERELHSTIEIALYKHQMEQKLRASEAALRESNQLLARAVAELKSTQEAIIREERLRALGQMACGVAHEFNNALSPIVGYSDLLLNFPADLADHAKVTSHLRCINAAARDAAHVVRRLRDFFRPRDVDEPMQAIDLNPLVHESVALAQPRWRNQAHASGAEIELRTELGATRTVLGNASELREVVLNLLLNAVDAMPSGGVITVRTEDRGEAVQLAISDTGMGMPEEVRKHCLEPFFTTKGRDGTGMGLAIVYGIVQRHTGSLEIDSELGKGTRVAVQLKSFQDGDRNLEPAPAGAPELTAPIRVLLVDDDARARRVLRDYLLRDGHKVIAAASAAEAMQRFDRSAVDLVVTDHAMPGMTGAELCRELKQAHPRLPVILVTGFADRPFTVRALADVDLVLHKPVTLVALRRALAAMTPRITTTFEPAR
ncbi:MAG: response regulator [Planctomycetota bacterium]